MILLVDNADSYTYNLYQLLSELTDDDVAVVPAAEIASPSPTARRIPDLVREGRFTHVVISPGPGHPGQPLDFAGSQAVIEAAYGIPLLGVCLGHQGLGLTHGAEVVRAPRARHGYISRLSHSGEGLFAGLPQDFQVVRYHSLHVVNEDRLRVHARSEDGLVMAFEVVGQPHWGVQFHPESILSEYGRELVGNFLRLSALSPALSRRLGSSPNFHDTPRPKVTHEKLELHARVRSFDIALDTEATFRTLASRSPGAPLFWLDPDQASGHGSRYSMMGAVSGPHSQTIRYQVESRTALIRTGDNREELPDIDIFELLNRLISSTSVTGLPADFPFAGGYFGYFGYELKSLVLGPNTHRADTPDAYWLRPESLIVYDHHEHIAHLLWLGQAMEIKSGAAAKKLDLLEEVLRGRKTGELTSTPALAVELPLAAPTSATEPTSATAPQGTELVGDWRLTYSDYLDRIDRARRHLRAGDSYEVCLTDRVLGTGTFDGLAYYCALRAANPAPYAAYFHFTEFDDDVEIASASPERFLTVNENRGVESKPIKGTSPRGHNPEEDKALSRTLREDAKTRAENLMIVDLLRNDLGRVCRAGSVTVPKLMEIESYPTVHQLVSTIRGELRPDVSTLDAIRACFPGGSMTGAPKMRTVEIIDTLEVGARGIYSGSIGYLGFDGRADLSIAIRTLVRHGGHWSVGAGGAIVLDSDPHAEHAEKNLKAEKLLRVLRETVNLEPARNASSTKPAADDRNREHPNCEENAHE